MCKGLRNLVRIFFITNPPAIIVGLILTLICHNTLQSQEKLRDPIFAFSDSISTNTWSDEIVYSIEILRLERWIRENTEKFVDPLLLNEVAQLKDEAQEFVANSDYALAVIWLETIWDLLMPKEEFDNDFEDSDLDLLNGSEYQSTANSTSRLNWSREIISGVDLWRQQFQFAFIQEDSTFLESSGNPFTGVRLNFDYYSDSRRSLQGGTSFRYSRDYFSGEVNIRYSSPLGRRSQWAVRNRFEGNSFYGDYNLKYIQNVSEVGVNIAELGPVLLEIEDEFLLRRYDDENATNPSYFNNAFGSLLKFEIGIGSFLGAGYRNVQRIHTTHKEYDYDEDRLDLIWYQTIGQSIGLSLEGELRWRDYTSEVLSQILQDHKEAHFRGQMRLPLTAAFGGKIQGSITHRDYRFVNATSLPDYLLWDLEPELYLNIGTDWRIGTGFFYGEQTYQNLLTRVDAAAVDATVSIPFDNIETYGPTFTLEFFRINGLMFSLRESFQLRRYPDTPTSDFLRSNPYSDRNVNSILFFFSWNFMRQWRFTALANVDHDRSRGDNSGDFQNTIVGLEVNYSF